MLDGKFQQGEVTHHVGRAVFVFLGGTHERAEGFVRKSEDESFKKLKMPDFVSRLKGFIDVPSINFPKSTFGLSLSKPSIKSQIIIRRAILLRSLIERYRPKLLERRGGSNMVDVEQGVLHALLCIPT